MSKDSLIYGIGDEFLFTAVIFACIIPVIIYYIPWRRYTASAARHLRGQNDSSDPHSDHLRGADATPRMYNSSQLCPICLNDQQLALETNCGHVYCGVCLQSLYTHSVYGAMSCPVCRQHISILFVCFTEGERQAPLTSSIANQRDELYRLVTSYNRRFSGHPRSIADHIRDLPTLLRHLWSEFFTLGGLVRFRLRSRIAVCFFAGIIYLFLPYDIIPETMFGILGLIDDILVIFFIIMYLATIYRSHVVARNFDSDNT